MPTSVDGQALFSAVKARLESSGAFGLIEVRGGMLVASAKASADPAFYRLEAEAGGLFVAMVTPSRWLSESIESDLVEHGDDLGELIEDELVELGWEGDQRPTFQHYRSADLLYTFRTPVPTGGAEVDRRGAAETAALWMLAYEQAFRRLGDMEDTGEE